MTARILVVDDNRDLARGTALILAPLSERIRVAHSAEDALKLLEAEPAELVLTDVKMPGMDGISLLEAVRARWPRTEVVVFTAFGTIDSAVDAMRRGAFHYITKPFRNDELVLVAERAVDAATTHAALDVARAQLAARNHFCGLYSRDPAMLSLFETIRRVADAKAAILVLGESGTGKELVARAIHQTSGRRDGPFVAFNAAAVPEALAEAELFGARKGAYTGADRDRVGLFEVAHGGTLFIDEVASTPLALQAKLLRALQEQEVQPLGASRPVPVDVRVVSAVNEEPPRLLRDGRLRRDLFYRLAVVSLSLPPLRDRLEDIPLLAEAFFASRAEGGRDKRLTPRALRLLLGHAWPGNVRELHNVLERAALMASTEDIEARHIAFEGEEVTTGLTASPSGGSYEEAKAEAVDQFQRRYFERMLGECGGNITEVARRSDMTRAAIHRILNRLGMTGGEGEPS